jgi:hypothetical protein
VATVEAYQRIYQSAGMIKLGEEQKETLSFSKFLTVDELRRVLYVIVPFLGKESIWRDLFWTMRNELSDYFAKNGQWPLTVSLMSLAQRIMIFVMVQI